MKPILDCQDLRKVYRTEAEEVHALRGVDLQVAAGEFVAIMGASGSGKSTLLQLLGALDHPTDGRILLDGCEYGRLRPKELTLLRRRRIGFVFQFFNLVPTLTAAENIQLPLLLDGRQPNLGLYSQLVSQLGLAGRTEHKPGQLSGGQQQRVAIARALMTEPAVVLADEPTGNLDSATAEEILWLLRNSCDQRGQTVVMVTHDPKAAAFADRMITLQDGRIVGEIQMGGADRGRYPLAGLAESL